MVQKIAVELRSFRKKRPGNVTMQKRSYKLDDKVEVNSQAAAAHPLFLSSLK